MPVCVMFGISALLLATPRLLWRTELRGFSARDRVFPDRSASNPFSQSDGFVFTSLALTI